MASEHIPKTQTVALLRKLGGDVEFCDDYPVPTPRQSEVLAKVLYTGVCVSDLCIKNGTATTGAGKPLRKLKLPHIGGHEGVGRIVALGPGCGSDLQIGNLVGIGPISRICHRCEFCLAGMEQYCEKRTDHMYHEPGCFQEYIVLDASYLAVLPDDVDPRVMGPVLGAGVTAYRAVMNANIRAGNWVVVVPAGGGPGHFAVQYAKAQGARVIGIDTGALQDPFVVGLGANEYIDYNLEDPVSRVREITGLGAHAVIVAAANASGFATACDMLRVGGTLSSIAIPSGGPMQEAPINAIIFRGLKVTGNLRGSLKECMEAVDLVRLGMVKSFVKVRPFRELAAAYEEMELGNVLGRIVLKVSDS